MATGSICMLTWISFEWCEGQHDVEYDKLWQCLYIPRTSRKGFEHINKTENSFTQYKLYIYIYITALLS